MFTVQDKPSAAQAIQPYVALAYRHFPHTPVIEPGLEIHPFWSGEGNLSYLLLNPASREVLLIDPDLEILGSYLLTLDREKLALRAVLDTHNHAEHATAAPLLATQFGVPYIMHAKAPSHAVTDRVKDGDTRTLAGLTVEALHTPGHTPCMTTYRVGNHIFTGDSLFNASCGRADLPGGSAGEQYDSIHRLAALPPQTIVHPGHDYNNRLSITIGEAASGNARLAIEPRETFTAWMADHYAGEDKPDDLMYYVAFNAR
ncbi:MAG: MBL fold metallo-hydrolase [Candidatus Melainabacteria bacterium]